MRVDLDGVFGEVEEGNVSLGLSFFLYFDVEGGVFFCNLSFFFKRFR